MNIPRRTFLKNALVATSTVALGTPLLSPLVMADWPKAAFEAKNLEELLKILFTDPKMMESDQVALITPEIAENGALVPVEISVNLPKVESIILIAEKNRAPLIGQFNFPNSDKTEYWIKTRIKMVGTSKVIAIVKAEGKLYRAHKEVKVTVGGCGS